jgi:hypothetical protein
MEQHLPEQYLPRLVWWQLDRSNEDGPPNTSADQVQWINGADFEADFAGVIPGLKDWIDSQCDKRTDVEKRLDDVFDAKIMRGEQFTPEEQSIRLMLLQKRNAQVECETMVEDKLREDAWKAYRG